MTQAAQPGNMPGGGQNLKAAIASQAAPSNPRTPAERTDPREETLLDQQRIRRAFEVAIEHRADDEDPLKKLYGPMHAAVTRLRDGTSIEDVTDALGLALFALVSPKTKAMLGQMISPANAQGGGMMGGPPMSGPPPAGPGPTAGGPPPMMGGGPPVSPGPPG